MPLYLLNDISLHIYNHAEQNFMRFPLEDLKIQEYLLQLDSWQEITMRQVVSGHPV